MKNKGEDLEALSRKL